MLKRRALIWACTTEYSESFKTTRLSFVLGLKYMLSYVNYVGLIEKLHYMVHKVAQTCVHVVWYS